MRSLNRRILESCYDSIYTNYILIRIVRFYQLTILPTIWIVRLILDRKIAEL